MRLAVSASFLFVLLLAPLAQADDWPGWLGPTRDSIWHESGILQEFPAEGPQIKFRVPVGYGYAVPAVAGDRVFVFDFEKTSGDI